MTYVLIIYNIFKIIIQISVSSKINLGFCLKEQFKGNVMFVTYMVSKYRLNFTCEERVFRVPHKVCQARWFWGWIRNLGSFQTYRI